MPGHTFVPTKDLGWDDLVNGLLLRAAADEGFDALLTNDKKMEYEHNLLKLPLPLVVMNAPSIALADIVPFAPAVLQLLAAPLSRSLYVIERDLTVIRVTAPRPKR